MRSLDSITFDVTNFTFRGDEDGVRIWHNAAGDGIGLYYFPLSPDIPADLNSLEDVRSAYRQIAAPDYAIIEVETPIIDKCSAVRVIFKVPQQPHGMTYLGSLTLPFRDFSYVLKIQCEELGITGLRDSEILDELLGTGEVTLDDGDRRKPRLIGWMQDPYEPSIKGSFSRNRSEMQEYDVRFPDHPLSRLRSTLNHIQNTLRVGDEIRREPSFVYQRTQQRRPWWKIWSHG